MNTIRDRYGREGRLLRAPLPGDDAATAAIALPDGSEARIPAAWLRPHQDGYVLPIGFDELRGARQEATLPLVEERLELGTQINEDVVRVRKVVREHDEHLRQELAREDVEIERVRVDREVAEAPAAREEGDTLIVPLLEEQIVWRKRLVVREEVRIRKRRRTEAAQVSAPVRREEIVVEREHGKP